jgi:hypothetical protein
MQAVLEYTESALQLGTLLGPYRLINFVKQGGMSTVYLDSGAQEYTYQVVDSSCVDWNMMYRERGSCKPYNMSILFRCLDACAYGSIITLVVSIWVGPRRHAQRKLLL